MSVLAAVDIGANSVRLKVARLEGRRLRIIAEDREVTRLGAAVFRDGRLEPAAMDRTLKVLRRFHRTVIARGAEAVRVVATSPLRDAVNADEFIAWVHAALGWRVEVISGLEEGRLIHLGVVSRMRLRSSRLLLIDLGGGSCELTVSRGGHIAAMHSLPLGAVRLTGDFLDHDPAKPSELERMREFIREEIASVAASIRRAGVTIAVATSGTAAALAASGGASGRVSAASVARLARKLARMGRAERQRVPGIGTRRTEIIVAGAWVFAELMELLPLRAFRYSPLGLRDGMLAQMMAERARGGSLRRRLDTDRGDALLALCRHYQVDLAYARHVSTLVTQLFTQLQSVHGLPPEYREWLAAAALLHEVGIYINHAGRHRHARYIVANAEIFGYTPRQRLLIANLVRFLGKTQPSDSDRGLQSLGAAAQLIPRGVALLRLARALNQGRHGAVKRVRARVGHRRVELKIESGRAGASLEQWAVGKETAYFRRVFGFALVAVP